MLELKISNSPISFTKISKPTVQSTVRLRFRKSISGHHFQTIGKLAKTDFQYHTTEGLFIVYINYFLQKNMFFFFIKGILHLFMVLLVALKMSFLALFWWKIMFVFSNACSILELMLCNQNLTKLDILTLLSSNCRAWALKLSEHLKKRTSHVFIFILPTPTWT